MKLRELLEEAIRKEWRSERNRVVVNTDGEDYIIAECYLPEHSRVIVALYNCAGELLAVREVAEKRPNKFGPHYLIRTVQMDAALRKLKEKEGKL